MKIPNGFLLIIIPDVLGNYVHSLVLACASHPAKCLKKHFKVLIDNMWRSCVCLEESLLAHASSAKDLYCDPPTVGASSGSHMRLYQRTDTAGQIVRVPHR